MELRNLTWTDLSQVAELERQCFTDPWSEDSLRAAMEEPLSCFLTAKEGDRVTGYAILQVVVDEGYLNNIAVAEGHRRQGVGGALLDAVLAEARRRGAAFLTLEVRTSTTAAIGLYQSRGFDIVGLRQNYYRHPTEHALLMTCYFQ